jgi:hypothetical protein
MGVSWAEQNAPHASSHPFQANSDDQALSRIRADFPGWRIWRAIKSDGSLGEWVATRHDPAAGVSATVMQPNPDALRAALVEERRQAELSGLW